MKKSDMMLVIGIPLIYLLVAETWDLLSDLFFTNLNLPSPGLSTVIIGKDLVFSAVTALLLVFLLRRELRTIKKTESSLRASEDRFRSLYENSPDGILLAVPDGEILAANPAACRMLGRDEVEIRQAGRAGIIEGSLPRESITLPVQISAEQAHEELIMKHKDGSAFPAEVTSAHFLDKNGSPRISMIIRDISRRKLAEDALVEREAHMRLLVEKMPALLWTTDQNLHYTYVAGSVVGHFGLRPGDMVGKPIGFTATNDNAFSFSYEQHRRVLQEGVPLSYDLQWQDIFFHVELEPLRDSSGAITGTIGVGLDISERVKAYQLLELRVDERTREIKRRTQVAEGLREILAILNSNGPLEEILDFILARANQFLQADSIALYLPEGETGELCVRAATGWDAEFQKELQYAPGEGPAAQAVEQSAAVIIQNVNPAVPGDGANSQAKILQALWQHAGPGNHGEMTVPLFLNGKAYGAIRLTYLDNQKMSSEQVALAVSVADQAALAIENSRLHSQAEQLAVLNERNRLARELHDSVTQATYSITLMAEAAQRMLDKNEIAVVKNLLARLATTAQQSLNEIRLLVYELRPDILETAGLVGAIQHRLDAVEKRAGLETRLLVNRPIELPFQLEEALYRIIQEALNNSLKHAHATQVSVSLQTDGMTVEVEVTDNGQGFDPETLKDSGGVGLSSIRERAEKLGGAVEIHSSPGQGTTIKIRACPI
jgi:PAS domain S-box-containing protein